MNKFTLSIMLVLASSAFAFAATKTGEITVDSKVDKVTNVAAGQNAQAKSNAHSVDVKEGAKTGDIIIKGKAGAITNVSVAQSVKSETNTGSVKAGGN